MATIVLTTPVAIVLAGALVGVGLFLGLRERRAPELRASAAVALRAAPGVEGEAPRPSLLGVGEPPQSPPSTPGEPPQSPSIGEAPPSSAPVGAASPDTPRVRREVLAALEAQRPNLLKTCWEPSVKSQPAPPTATFVFNFSFDAGGQQIIRGSAEGRANRRPGLTSCLSVALKPLEVSPPGARVYVEVPLALP